VAIGKQTTSLPASVTAHSSKTVGPLAAVTALNAHYINKIDVIRDKLASALPPTLSTWPRKTAQYSHSFTSAGRITRIVRKLGTTEANGTMASLCQS
jgi:hypothetical protein